MKIAHPFFPPTTAQIWMHRFALNRTGTNESDFNDNVVKATRLKPGQSIHLRARFNLKDSHRVCRAQQVIHSRVFVFEFIEGKNFSLRISNSFLLKRLKNRSQGSKHSQSKEVKLHQSGVCTILLIPLDHASPPRFCPTNGADLAHGMLAEDHPSGVNPHMARKPTQKLGTGGKHHLRRGRVCSVVFFPSLSSAWNVSRVNSQSPGSVFIGQLRTVCNHCCHLSGTSSSIALVDILDDFFTAGTVDVDINVRGS